MCFKHVEMDWLWCFNTCNTNSLESVLIYENRSNRDFYRFSWGLMAWALERRQYNISKKLFFKIYFWNLKHSQLQFLSYNIRWGHPPYRKTKHHSRLYAISLSARCSLDITSTRVQTKRLDDLRVSYAPSGALYQRRHS